MLFIINISTFKKCFFEILYRIKIDKYLFLSNTYFYIIGNTIKNVGYSSDFLIDRIYLR